MSNNIGTEVDSGICATRSDTPDMTFVWNTKPDGKLIKVTVSYGGGDATDNHQSTTIPLNSSDPVSIGNSKNPQIGVKGSVRAIWGAGGSYALIFQGSMVRGNVNNVYSSPNPESDGIIVAAYLV